MTKRELITRIVEESKGVLQKGSIEDNILNLDQVDTVVNTRTLMVKEILSDEAIDILYYNLLVDNNNQLSKCLDAFKRNCPDEFKAAIIYAYNQLEDTNEI